MGLNWIILLQCNGVAYTPYDSNFDRTYIETNWIAQFSVLLENEGE